MIASVVPTSVVTTTATIPAIPGAAAVSIVPPAVIASIVIASIIIAAVIIAAVIVAAIVVPAIVITTIVAIVVTIVTIVQPVIAPTRLVHLNLFETRTEAIVIAVVTPVVIDDYDTRLLPELPEPTLMPAPIAAPTDDFDPKLPGPVAIVASIVVAIARSDDDVPTDRTPATDPDIGADALGAGGAS
jgi:hypothetical protein